MLCSRFGWGGAEGFPGGGGRGTTPRKKKRARRAAEGSGRRPEGGQYARFTPFEEKRTLRTKGEGRGKCREAEGRHEKTIGKRGAGLRTWRLTAWMTHIRWGRLVSIAAVLSPLIRFVCFCFFFAAVELKKENVNKIKRTRGFRFLANDGEQRRAMATHGSAAAARARREGPTRWTGPCTTG